MIHRQNHASVLLKWEEVFAFMQIFQEYSGFTGVWVSFLPCLPHKCSYTHPFCEGLSRWRGLDFCWSYIRKLTSSSLGTWTWLSFLSDSSLVFYTGPFGISWWCNILKYLLHSKRLEFLLDLTASLNSTNCGLLRLKTVILLSTQPICLTSFSENSVRINILALNFPCSQLLQPKIMHSHNIKFLNYILLQASHPEQCMCIVCWKHQIQKLKATS